MTKRFDVCTPRPKFGHEGKSWWHRVGSATENDRGQIIIYLDSVPVPDAKKDNKIVMMLFEPREKEPAKSGKKAAEREEMDDEIPF
jgi:hypothetical protein